jgi:hypothetical protein
MTSGRNFGVAPLRRAFSGAGIVRSVFALTTAQLLFSIALGSFTLLITAFGLYVARTTFWGDRWYPRSSK